MTALSVVVGGGSGIGAAAVQTMLDRGDTVIGVDLDTSNGAQAVQWIEGDAADQTTWDRLATAIAEAGRPVDNVVYGAAYLAIGNLLELTDTDWQKTFEVNTMGMVRCMRTVLPGMIAAKSGAIVTIGSIDSVMAEQGLLAYCTSKGGVAQFTRTLAMDHARDGIRANCLCPGVTDTPLFRRHLASASDPEQFLGVREQRNPIGRLLRSSEIGDAIAFLASPASSGMTGAIILVDGGLTASFDFRTGAEGG